MFLATTNFTPFWDTTDELLFLGPACARYDRRHEWEGLKFQFLPNRWDDRERLDRDIAYCVRAGEHLVEVLAAYLNEVHGVSHESRYWRILLGFWLHYYVHDLYTRYLNVREALEVFPDIRTLTLAPECWITPRDTAESVALYDSDRYPLQLYAQILRAVGRGEPSRAAEFSPSLTVAARLNATAGLRAWARRGVRRGLKWIQPRRGLDIALCDLNVSWRHVWSVVRGSGFRAWPFLESLPAGAEAEREVGPRRDGLGALKGEDEFERVLISTLPFTFPTVFLEGHARAREVSLAHWTQVPKVVVSSLGWVFNEPFKLFAAECAERGSRLLGVQHGGVYGLGKNVAGEVLERAITDRWYAWGWADLASDPKVRNLPHPGLSALAGTTPNVRADQILYVSTDFPISTSRLHNSPIENQYEEYFTWRLKFIGALSEPVRERLFVRLYPIDFGWTQSQRLKAAIPDVCLDDFTQGFEGRLSQARLAVFDHPGTTFLQGMVSGIPCVLFWKPSHWETRDSAKPYLDCLRDAEILHDDPVAAAGQVLRVWNEPERWWGSAQVREAREAFVEHFALAGPDWVETWVRELTAEVALAERHGLIARVEREA